MTTEAVIFDWAGTTVDYGSFAPVQAFIDAFAERKIAVTLPEVRKPMGMLKRDHIKTMLAMPRIKTVFEQEHGRGVTEQDINELLETFTAKLMRVLEQETLLKPHVLEVFNELKARGIKIGSTTGYTNQMLTPVAQAAGKLGYRPDTMLTADGVNGFGRPYPYMIFENLRQLEVLDVRNVIKVGDTVADVQEAKNAGVQAFVVLEGSSVIGLSQAEYEQLNEGAKNEALETARQVFAAAGADQILLNLAELPQFL